MRGKQLNRYPKNPNLVKTNTLLGLELMFINLPKQGQNDKYQRDNSDLFYE